jgi:hypothetical protein
LMFGAVRIDHYTQLVRAELHLAINDGTTITACAKHARTRVPWWSDAAISDLLIDRGNDPMLRSYLWAYPAGINWFVSLADADAKWSAPEVLRGLKLRPLV